MSEDKTKEAPVDLSDDEIPEIERVDQLADGQIPELDHVDTLIPVGGVDELLALGIEADLDELKTADIDAMLEMDIVPDLDEMIK